MKDGTGITYRPGMRFSVWPNLAQPWSDIVAVTTHAEATGWDGVYAADHFMGDNQRAGDRISPTLEATAALAGLAMVTDRLRLGSLVFGNTYRHPAVLANWAKTVDHMSGGRLLLGMGAGWQINEHEQYGIELGRPRPRIDRFEEALQVLAGLLRTPVANVAGEHYTLTDAVMEPKPVQDPLPILIGAKGDRMMGIVARYADEWNMWSLPAEFAERSAFLDAACESIGRDPATITRSTQALFFIDDDRAKVDGLIERVQPRPAIGGTADELIEAVQGWADVGVDEVIVLDATLGTGTQRLENLDLLIEQVAVPFRALSHGPPPLRLLLRRPRAQHEHDRGAAAADGHADRDGRPSRTGAAAGAVPAPRAQRRRHDLAAADVDRALRRPARAGRGDAAGPPQLLHRRGRRRPVLDVPVRGAAGPRRLVLPGL